MRDAWIGDLTDGSRRSIAGRVIALVCTDGGAHGVLLDDTGRIPFVGPVADLRRGDLAALVGARATNGVFTVESSELVARPVRDPVGDSEFERLSTPALREHLAAENRLHAAIRSFFDERGFLEVRTGLLVDEPGQEPYLEPFVTSRGDALITSPELRMKRLLAGGFERIYQLSAVFRDGDGECSPLHQPEFTLLEWYRTFAGEAELVSDLSDLLLRTAERVSGDPCARRGERGIPLGGMEICTVADAFERLAGVDLEPFLDGDDEGFRKAVRRADYPVARGERTESLFFRVLLDRVEPRLGESRPTLLKGYPASMAALARLDDDDPRIARRYELYIAGVELANAFEELVDPVEQRRRFEADRRRKRELGHDPGAMPERFLRALEHGVPPALGCALGVDRLLLLLRGADSIGELRPFPKTL